MIILLMYIYNGNKNINNMPLTWYFILCRIPYWLSEKEERKEIQNILNGQPTYLDLLDLEQVKTNPIPN